MGDEFFDSVRYASANQATHTKSAGGSVTWTWATTRDVPRGLRSMRSPTFTVAFTAPDTYRYDATVDGSPITGTTVLR